LRQRSAGVSDWRVYFSVLGNTGAMILNTTTDFVTDSSYWNNTTPSSTVFSLGNNVGMNGNGSTYVAYSWAEIPGFSKFGSYTGNSSTNGPFVFTGFRPTWILIKQITSSGDGWYVYDTQRNKYNPTNIYLWANGANVDQTSGDLDILSNGFKLRTAASALNYTGYTYIYAAFAESPTQNLFGGQSNAR